MVLGSQVLLRNVSEHQLADFLPRANLSTTPFSMSISQKESLNLICHDKNCLLWFCLYLQHLLLGFAFWFGRPCRPLVRSIFEGSSSLSFWSFLDLRTKVVMDLNISSTLMLSLAEVSKSWIPIWSANLRASSVSTTFTEIVKSHNCFICSSTFLSGSSFLLPTRILLTTSQFASISWSHLEVFNH